MILVHPTWNKFLEYKDLYFGNLGVYSINLGVRYIKILYKWCLCELKFPGKATSILKIVQTV